jgi:hypothetical protein
MLKLRQRLFAVLACLLLLGVQAHGVLHLLGHAHEDAGDPPCQICVQGLQQVAVESHAPVLPVTPAGFELTVAAPAAEPEHFFEVLSRQRGPPRALPVL